MLSKLLSWIARISGTALALFLFLMVTGEAAEPNGVAEWFYLAFFPFGFSIGLLLG